MARATNSPASRKRRKKVLKYAKGYFGNKSKLFRYAKEAVQHAWQYAYRDRKKKKSDFRGLWIVRLNAACRNAGISWIVLIDITALACIIFSLTGFWLILKLPSRRSLGNSLAILGIFISLFAYILSLH